MTASPSFRPTASNPPRSQTAIPASARGISIPCHPASQTCAPKAKSERRDDMGTGQKNSGRLPPKTAHHSSVAKPTLRRQTSKVGAVCLNWARTDLCGGRSAMSVPTAMIFGHHQSNQLDHTSTRAARSSLEPVKCTETARVGGRGTFSSIAGDLPSLLP
jgi:hypothetical protein